MAHTFKRRPIYSFFAVMLAAVFAVTFLIARTIPPETAPEYPFWPPARELRDGYNMIAEDSLLHIARIHAGLDPYSLSAQVGDETVYEVRVGDWQLTAAMPRFRADPDQPLFVYAVKGSLVAGASAGGLSIDPNAPTAVPEALTGFTVVLDAVTGDMITYYHAYLTELPNGVIAQQPQVTLIATPEQ